MKEQIRAFLLHVVSAEMNLPVNPAEVADDTPMGVGGLDLESLGLAELAMHVEQEFDIKIRDEDFEWLATATLGAVVDRLAAVAPVGGARP